MRKASLVGIITRGEYLRRLTKIFRGRSLLEAGSRRVIVTYPDETL